jgi:NitT/TauT family transport system permease protein
MTARLRERPELVSVPAVAIVLVVGWELAVRLLKVPAYVLPPPSRIVVALVRGFATPVGSREGYLLHTAHTGAETLLGFLLGSATGILLGTALAQSRLLEKTFLPFIVGFQALPKVAVAPLFLIWFGFGLTSKVLIAALITFFPLLVNSLVGLRSVPEDRLELMRVISASRWQTFRMVQFPTALPFIFAGLELGVVYSLIGAIVGEFLGGESGLGVLIMQMNLVADIAGVFSALLILSTLAILLHVVIRSVERRVLFWAPREWRQTGA